MLFFFYTGTSDMSFLAGCTVCTVIYVSYICIYYMMILVINTSVPGNVWSDNIILSYARCCVKIQRNGIKHILNVPVPSFPNWKATVKKLILWGLIWCLILVICLLCHPLSCWSSHHTAKYFIQCTGGVHDLPFKRDCYLQVLDIMNRIIIFL